MPRDELRDLLVELLVVLLIGVGVGLVGGWSLAVSLIGPKPTTVSTGVRDSGWPAAPCCREGYRCETEVRNAPGGQP